MNMLARREQSRAELRQKLYERYIANPRRQARKRGFDAETADAQSASVLERVQEHLSEEEALAPDVVLTEVLDRLQMQGLQDDGRFAESFVRARYNRGDGPMKIRNALRNKGRETDAIQTLLADEQFDWFTSARETLLRKFDDNAIAAARQDIKMRAKQQRFLAGRGFTADQVREAMLADASCCD
jgi:regulatory protein